jgi:hypothetical protein
MAKNEKTHQKKEVDQKDVYTAYFNLHSALRDAYWSTPDEATGNSITALADACFHILTGLNQDAIKSRDTEYTDLKRFVENTNKRLQQTKDDIDKIIHSVKIATDVANGIEQVLKLAAKFFV